jgi:ligand-binding SRPBCC domain-containing protein
MSINYEHKTHVKSDIKETFAWHERKGSFRRLMPPWEVAEEVRADDTLEDGAQRISLQPSIFI